MPKYALRVTYPNLSLNMMPRHQNKNGLYFKNQEHNEWMPWLNTMIQCHHDSLCIFNSCFFLAFFHIFSCLIDRNFYRNYHGLDLAPSPGLAPVPPNIHSYITLFITIRLVSVRRHHPRHIPMSRVPPAQSFSRASEARDVRELKACEILRNIDVHRRNRRYTISIEI